MWGESSGSALLVFKGLYFYYLTPKTCAFPFFFFLIPGSISLGVGETEELEGFEEGKLLALNVS